jgi:hypothetical protein
MVGVRTAFNPGAAIVIERQLQLEQASHLRLSWSATDPHRRTQWLPDRWPTSALVDRRNADACCDNIVGVWVGLDW